MAGTYKSTRRAIIQGAGANAGATLTVVPTPPLGKGEALIRTVAVAINPTDHKMPTNFPSPGAIIGCDFAGVVVELNSESSATSPIKVGDRVAGAVHGSNPLDRSDGAFTEYVKTSADLLFKVPETMSWSDAAAIGGTGHGSLCLALWHALSLSGHPQNPIKESEYVLGGSTATGTMALQLLRLSGYLPVAVCSPHNFSLAKEYGAHITFDYASPTVAQDIRAYTKNTLFYAVDCITDEASIAICYQSIGRAGGLYASLERCPAELQVRKAIKPTFVLGYEMFGKTVALKGDYWREPNQQAREAAVSWYKIMEELCYRGLVKAHPVRLVPGQWNGLISGIDILRKGNVSGQKLVVLVGES